MAVAYSSSGAGVGTETNGAALQPACPATVNAGEVLVAHVVHLNTTTAPENPAGWKLMYGPANIGVTTVQGRHWCFAKVADGSEDGASVSFGTAGGTSGRAARIYSFTGRTGGQIDNIMPISQFSSIPHDTDPQGPTVNSLMAGALAVALKVQDDNNTPTAIASSSGGSWTERAEYINATWGPQGICMAIDTCTPTGDPGTVSGGAEVATNDEAGVIGFVITPSSVQVDPVVQTIRADAENVNSMTLTLGQSTVAGNFLGLQASVWTSGTPPTNASPSGLGSWSTLTPNGLGNNQNAHLAYNENCSAGTQVTYDVGTGFYGVVSLTEFAGVKNSGSLDQQDENGNSSSTTPTCGATGTLAQADELVLAVLTANQNNVNVGIDLPATPGYTNLTFEQDSARVQGASHDYKVVSATTAVDIAWGTLSAAMPWSSIMGTFKLVTTQNLTPSLYTDGDTFFSPTVTPGAVNLAPSLYTDSDSFHTPTVGATYALSPSLYTDADSFHSPTVTPGAVDLAPALYTDADSFHTPTVTPGAVDLAPTLYEDTDSFHSPTVAATYNLSPDLYSDGDTFYSPTVTAEGSGAQDLAPELYSDADSFHSPTVAATYNLAPALYSDEDSFYSPAVAATYALSPERYDDADTFHQPTVIPGAVDLSVALYNDADAFYSPEVLKGAVDLAPELFLDADAFHTPVVGRGAVELLPALFVDPDTFHRPTVTGGAGGPPANKWNVNLTENRVYWTSNGFTVRF